VTPADIIVAGTLAMLPRVQERMALARALDLPVAMVWRKMLLPDGSDVARTARDYMRAA
jgi:hypothetical protein